MRHLLLPLAMLFAAPAVAAEPQPVQIMVLGTYHMDNPGHDIANVAADDVTAPRRQKELAAIADALATWKPTKIVLEMERPAPFTIPGYHDFKDGDLATDRNEIVQIGYRLGRKLGMADVYGFDEQPGEGEPDYFPFDKVESWAKAHDMSGQFDSLVASYQARAKEMAAMQSGSVASILLAMNNPKALQADHERGYLGVLKFGDGEAQPGADLNAMWYLRNLKMFAKIGLIAQPGDRVLVLVGAGHGYWLNQLAAGTPGFVDVDVRPYLQVAVAGG